MVLFTQSTVPIPTNAPVIIIENNTTLHNNGNKITAVTEIDLPLTSVAGAVNAIVSTSTVTTVPATQTTPSSSSVIVTTGNNGIPTSSVALVMSDGSTTVVFDSVLTGLYLLEFMQSRNQYYLQASDDVMIINVSGIKLLILETAFMNQKLMNSFTFIYARGKVRCVHRTLATVMSLTDALCSVGYKRDVNLAFMNNYDLQDGLIDVSRPRTIVFDYNYTANPQSSSDGSLLEDIGKVMYS